MKIQQEIARQFKEAHFGKNWTGVGLKDAIDDITLAQSLSKVGSCNTILKLTYHIFYYTAGVLQFVKGGPLEIRDKFSFDHPDVNSEADWEALKKKGFQDVEELATLIETLPEKRFYEIFYEERYGSYFRNFVGIMEHTHYHLGQIVLIKKLILGLA